MDTDPNVSAEAGASMPPPRENLIRALPQGVELRQDAGSTMPTLTGHFAVWDQWTEINSVFEGRFLERFAPTSMNKTLSEGRDQMRVLFQHGQDPQVGDKVLGPIARLEPDASGAAYEVPLLDTSYNRDLIPGLQAGLYGASFRFQVLAEDFVRKPKPSDYNPDGLPERTITEARVREFGPVTFPAYAGATAGLRSLTDEFLFGRYTEDTDRFVELLEAARQPTVLSVQTPEITTSTNTREEPEPPEATTPQPEPEPPEATTRTATEPDTGQKDINMNSIEEIRTRLAEIGVRFQDITAEAGTEVLGDAQKSEWDTLLEERATLEERAAAYEARLQVVNEYANRGSNTNRPQTDETRVASGRGSRVPDDIYNVAEYRNLASSPEQHGQALRDGAMKAVEIATFAHPDAKRQEQQEHIARLLDTADDDERSLARRVLTTSSPTYIRAFGKQLLGKGLTPDEQRALSLTTTAGGFAVPVTLDPTVILTSNGVVNPLRAISRIVTITGNTWEGISSAGITAAYAAEVTEAGDDAPTIDQPTANVEKAQAFVPFSIEIGEDWGSIQSELAMMFQDAKDTLESEKFLTGLGHGSHVPEGLLVGGTAYVNTAATATFAVGDVYKLEQALAPRWRPRASILANKATLNKIRQFDTSGGASLWVQLGDGTPSRLLDYPTYEYSDMSSTPATTGASTMVVGDFSNFLIVDRVGMSIELIPHLFATGSNRPSGSRGLYCYWRNTSQVLTQAAFKTLVVL